MMKKIFLILTLTLSFYGAVSKQAYSTSLGDFIVLQVDGLTSEEICTRLRTQADKTHLIIDAADHNIFETDETKRQALRDGLLYKEDGTARKDGALTSVTLSGLAMGPKTYETFRDTFFGVAEDKYVFPALEELVFSDIRFEPAVEMAGAAWPHIRSLEIASSPHFTLGFLARFPGLTSMSMRGMQVEDDSMAAIADYLGAVPLRSLYLQSLNLSTAACIAMGESIKGKTLETLHIADCEMTHEKAKHFLVTAALTPSQKCLMIKDEAYKPDAAELRELHALMQGSALTHVRFG